MPAIAPPGGAVDWPADEGTLGVVGVAPWATIEFCRAFYDCFKVQKDWHYPRVLLDVNTKLPSRGRHLQLGETDPSPFIAESIQELARQGATVVVVPCNTAHILFDRWAAASPVPVVNIVEETVQAARAKNRDAPIACLTSGSLATSRLYETTCANKGLEAVELSDGERRAVSHMIAEIKATGRFDRSGTDAVLLVDGLTERKVGSVILGCTELSSLVPELEERGIAVTDSNRALAVAAARRLNVAPEHLAIRS